MSRVRSANVDNTPHSAHQITSVRRALGPTFTLSLCDTYLLAANCYSLVAAQAIGFVVTCISYMYPLVSFLTINSTIYTPHCPTALLM
jgi:hypothetical protein